ncbi:DUF4145 domain-containing protein [Falsibacillus albus]|uniref:DUF4145 domain-containing protein n=1 Tax=Falsibacillus albus TaxID=2478915 RepID=A0A3L7JRZ6_9BACI|nr:DUF4145 domain-containing protein [Falsibacillus albus]RLQ93627.1 DUF4145 domain-containing protein [Falsibacillus albus]
MRGKSLFEFIEVVSKDLLALAEDLESMLFSQPQSVMIQARLYTENLIKLVSKDEGIEDVYPLKHSERIHKLYRQNAIEEDIYIKLEWVRKMGNKAAHDLTPPSLEDGMKAHRYLFDISVWYMQVYVNYDFEAPVYKLRAPEKSENPSLSEEQISELMKPFFEKGMQQIDKMRDEIQQQLDAIKEEKERLAFREDQVTEGEAGEEKESFFLFQYLNQEGLEYIDKRDKKGALWVVGDWSLKEKLFALKEHKLYFRFSKNGARSTNQEPAWFLMNKSFHEQPDDYKQNQPVPKVHVPERKLATPVAEIREVPKDFWQSAGQINHPVHLAGMSLENFFISAEGLEGCQTFSSLNEDRLRQLYKVDKESFFTVMQELYFLGFRFQDRMAAFQPGPSLEKDCMVRIKHASGLKIRDVAPFAVSEGLAERNIRLVQELDLLLLSSLNWWTGTDNEDWLKKIKYNAEVANSEAEKKEISDHGEHSLIYKGEQLSISLNVAEAPLNEIGVEGCEHLINKFQSIGVDKLKDIDFPLDGIHEKLKGVGERTVDKFWSQLPAERQLVIQPVEETDGERKVFFEGQIIVIPEELKEIMLDSQDFPGAEKAIGNMKQNGIESLKDLPADLKKLKEIKGVGIGKVKAIVEKLPAIIQRELNLAEIASLPPSEYYLFLMKECQEWIGRITESEENAKAEKIQPRYLELTKNRFDADLEGQHLTLEALGQEAGLTRERIRQIIAKGDQRLAGKVEPVIRAFFAASRDSLAITELKDLDLSSFKDYLMAKGLEVLGYEVFTRGGLTYITKLGRDALEDLEKSIVREFREAFHLHVISQEDLTHFCEEKAEDDALPDSFVSAVAKPEITWVAEGQGILSTSRKKDVVEMVMLQYPEGVDVYKQEQELINKANDFMPGEFEGERAFYSIATRADLSETFILWDRGRYIHNRFVTAEESFIKDTQEIAVQIMEKDGPIHVLKLYERVKKEALEQNIPSEYGLYSLMRKYSDTRLDLQKFPHIYPEGTDRQMNADHIKEFIRDRGGLATYQEMYEQFVEKKGWKRFTLEYNLTTNEEIVSCGRGEYTLLSLYSNVSSSDLDFVTAQIRNKLEESPITLIHSFFEQNELLIRDLGIKSKQLLHAILKDRERDSFRMPRYPYILTKDATIDQFSAKGLIEEYIQEQQDIVPREEVSQWITDVFGENDSILDIVLLNSKEILYYSKGQYGEYIHKQTIGYNAELEQRILKAAEQLFCEESALRGREYVFLEELVKEDVLPELANDIDWGAELLGDILKKSGQWNLIGSYGAILTPKSSSISTNTDFIGLLLKTEFDGSVRIKDLRQYLAAIQYSNEGKLLVEVEEALKNQSAPFEIDGDEILLRDWSEVNI